MSLDVTLMSAELSECGECGHKTRRECLYTSNITHNLNKMAEEAGIYSHLWRPDEIGVAKAGDLIGPLSDGLSMMKADRPRFEKFNAPNGWGLYEHFIPWVEDYLEACKRHPDALVSVSR